MRKQKMYNLNMLNAIKTEVNKFKNNHSNETTLDKLLLQAKSDIVPLINQGYSLKDVLIILKNAGIQTTIAKIKQLYLSSKSIHKPTPKVNQSVNESQPRACRHEILSHIAKHLICTAARNDFEFFAYLVAMPRQSLILRNAFSTRCRSLYNSLSNDLCSFRLRLGGITTFISF